MKKIFLLLFVVPLLCSGIKDPCKKISKKTHRKAITYTSPDLDCFTVIKQVKVDPFFVLLLHFADDDQHFDTHGASIEFEDGTIIKDGDTKVDCQQEISEISAGFSSSSSSRSGKYVVQGFFHITDEVVEKFVSKKIIKIRLDNAAKKIPDKEASLLMTYLKCLQNRN